MKKIIFIFVLSFVLNFLWEIAQAFLYAPHYVGISGLVTVHLRASLGDIVMIFMILVSDALIFRNVVSGKKISSVRFLVMICGGLVLAVLVEKYALATSRWAYAPLMPIIPWLNVGLTPILQMMVIPPFVAVYRSRFKKIG